MSTTSRTTLWSAARRCVRLNARPRRDERRLDRDGSQPGLGDGVDQPDQVVAARAHQDRLVAHVLALPHLAGGQPADLARLVLAVPESLGALEAQRPVGLLAGHARLTHRAHAQHVVAHAQHTPAARERARVQPAFDAFNRGLQARLGPLAQMPGLQVHALGGDQRVPAPQLAELEQLRAHGAEIHADRQRSGLE